MQVGLYQSVSGMKAMMAYQNNLSANLARQSVVGGRSTITAFEILEEQPNQKKGTPGLLRPVGHKALPLQTQSVVDFSQGTMQRTGNEYDFAIQGKAFFSVREPGSDGQGVIRYTRNGQFRLDSEGKMLTDDGAEVLLEGDTPLQLDPRGDRRLTVMPNGTVYVGDSAQPLGRLKMVHFDEPRQALQSTSTGRFEAMDPKLVRDGTDPQDRIEQGFVENANTNGISEMVNLISVMRGYESNQKAIQVQDEVNGRLISAIHQVG